MRTFIEFISAEENKFQAPDDHVVCPRRRSRLMHTLSDYNLAGRLEESEEPGKTLLVVWGTVANRERWILDIFFQRVKSEG